MIALHRTVRRAATLATLAVLAACAGGEQGASADSATSATPSAAPVDSASAGTGSAAVTDSTATAGMLDPNVATREQLAAVPGMTPSAADAIVAARPYADMVAVNRALSAALPDSAARAQVYAKVWTPIDLNTASDAEILLIPGIGRRMLGEFKEYRPYKTIAQFRREIGKYVSEDEVARLERYVKVN